MGWGCGLPGFLKPALPQLIPSQPWNQPAGEGIWPNEPKIVEAPVENSIFWFCFRVCRNRKGERRGKLRFLTCGLCLHCTFIISEREVCLKSVTFSCDRCGIHCSVAGLLIVTLGRAFWSLQLSVYAQCCRILVLEVKNTVLYILCACDNQKNHPHIQSQCSLDSASKIFQLNPLVVPGVCCSLLRSVILLATAKWASGW